MVIDLTLWRVLTLKSKVANSVEATPNPVSVFMALLSSDLYFHSKQHHFSIATYWSGIWLLKQDYILFLKRSLQFANELFAPSFAQVFEFRILTSLLGIPINPCDFICVGSIYLSSVKSSFW